MLSSVHLESEVKCLHPQSVPRALQSNSIETFFQTISNCSPSFLFSLFDADGHGAGDMVQVTPDR